MPTLIATERMHSRYVTVGQNGLAKRPRAELPPAPLKPGDILRAIEALAPAVQKEFHKIYTEARQRAVEAKAAAHASLVTAALPGLAALPELSPHASAEERAALHNAELDIILRYLRERFPKVFDDPAVPLAVGVREQLRARTSNVISKRRLDRVFSFWTQQPVYLEALASGQPRRNLDGTISDVPTSQAVAVARQQLAQPAPVPATAPAPAPVPATAPAPPPRPVLLSREERGLHPVDA